MYAFGLLGAFTLTCLGLDIIRHRERNSALAAQSPNTNGNNQEVPGAGMAYVIGPSSGNAHNNEPALTGGLELENVKLLASPVI